MTLKTCIFICHYPVCRNQIFVFFSFFGRWADILIFHSECYSSYAKYAQLFSKEALVIYPNIDFFRKIKQVQVPYVLPFKFYDFRIIDTDGSIRFSNNYVLMRIKTVMIHHIRLLYEIPLYKWCHYIQMRYEWL